MPYFSGSQLEAAAFGQITSLSGSKGKVSFGRQITTAAGTLTATVPAVVAGINTSRISVLVQNTGTANLLISFGGTTTTGLNLVAGAAMQFDAYFPWTGALVLYSAAGTTYEITEISNLD